MNIEGESVIIGRGRRFMVEVAEFAAFQTRRGAVPDAVPDSQGLLDLVAALVLLGEVSRGGFSTPG